MGVKPVYRRSPAGEIDNRGGDAIGRRLKRDELELVHRKVDEAVAGLQFAIKETETKGHDAVIAKVFTNYMSHDLRDEAVVIRRLKAILQMMTTHGKKVDYEKCLVSKCARTD